MPLDACRGPSPAKWAGPASRVTLRVPEVLGLPLGPAPHQPGSCFAKRDTVRCHLRSLTPRPVLEPGRRPGTVCRVQSPERTVRVSETEVKSHVKDKGAGWGLPRPPRAGQQPPWGEAQEPWPWRGHVGQHLCVHVSTRVCTRVRVCTLLRAPCVFLDVCVHVHLCERVCVHVCASGCVCVCVSACMCVPSLGASCVQPRPPAPPRRRAEVSPCTRRHSPSCAGSTDTSTARAPTAAPGRPPETGVSPHGCVRGAGVAQVTRST